MSTLQQTLELYATEPIPEGRCFACRNFAAGKRDARGFLMRTRRGYCDWPQHPGGEWNVIQNIVHQHRCAGFEPADAEAVEKRRAWLIRHADAKEEL